MEMVSPEDVIGAQSAGFAEELYAEFLRDPALVPPGWRKYFASLQPRGTDAVLAPSFHAASIFNPLGVAPNGNGQVAAEVASRQDRVDQLVRAYRVSGHLEAKVDPLGIPRPPIPWLDPACYGLTAEDMARSFSSTTIAGPPQLKLREIIERLRHTYCGSIGVQYMHIDDTHIKDWLQERMESTENRLALSHDEQLSILRKLTDAVVFEDFIQKKYLGAKRFSLEGAESLIPLLQLAIEKAGEQRVNGIVIGMAHRGRLNVLANIIGKGAAEVFREFEDSEADTDGHRGDVKYHLGYSTKWRTASGHVIHVSLCFNPSHLEFVNPMALGRVRANLDRHGRRGSGMAILIHGDASFAGQGIVQEVLNLSQLRGYTTNGTIHVILNNQLGFTTDPADGRSTLYASGVARMLQVPIFHVNGEDPEAVDHVIDLAMDFRSEFQRDVVIDMYCYRRRGHNEGDEPSFTQPLMYKAIAQRKSVRDGYVEHLLRLGEVATEQADEIGVESRARLERELSLAREGEHGLAPAPPGERWVEYQGGPEKDAAEVATGVPAERLSSLLESLARLPEGFTPHPKITRLLEQRRAMARGEAPLDWATAEQLAFATLATEGVRVRLSGQDSERGTFSQRHSVLHDYETGATYEPLKHLAAGQAAVEVFNSPLSEAGVLGFEYGYSLDCPEGLVLWEAQFGDFCNVAQPIIDQFIASAEEKWSYLSGLVLLLPHGFEGMGSEHSSARLERFLQLACCDNIQVVNLTTPAQYFHALRRQALRKWRKPLVVMAPKSLLRHPCAVSTLADLELGSFRRVLYDAQQTDAAAIRRVLLCSGKLFYELDEARTERQRGDVAILRLEQLYPLPEGLLAEALERYADGTPVWWVQEEPENMGAWHYLKLKFADKLFGGLPLHGICRAAASSPATGSLSVHRREQQELINRAFDGL
jgi:2-oxoglutarate dehydrogenase E1 component